MVTTDSYTTNAAASGGEISFSTLHAEIIQTHILAKLDGPTLASAGCASSLLQTIITGDGKLWRDICNHTWPSTADPVVDRIISEFPAGYHSLYSDTFPLLQHHHPKKKNKKTSEFTKAKNLLSAVDIYYHKKLIVSKVLKSETETMWFQCSPFRVDLVDSSESSRPLSLKCPGCEEESCIYDLEDNMSLSWVLIDPARKRAANFSSLKPVDVTRDWLTGNLLVRYVTILAGERKGELVQCIVMVTCGAKEGEELEVNEVSLAVEDVDGNSLSGKDSLVILQNAMENGDRKKGKIGEEKRKYEDYLEMKRGKMMRKHRRQRSMDLACIAVGVFIFFAWIFVFLSRYF